MFFSVNKKVVFGFLIKFLIVFSVFLVTACDIDENLTESFADQDTYEARLDDAVIKLDNGEYQAAKDIIDDLIAENPNDEYLYELRASCYVGLAGIDSLSALDKIDSVADQGELDPSDIILSIIGDSNGEITATGIDTTIDNLELALNDLRDNLPANPTDGQLTQIALFSAYDILAKVAKEAIRITGNDPLVINDLTTLDASSIPGSSEDALVLDKIREDINSLLDIPASSPLNEPVTEFLEGLGRDASDADIRTWLQTNL